MPQYSNNPYRHPRPDVTDGGCRWLYGLGYGIEQIAMLTQSSVGTVHRRMVAYKGPRTRRRAQAKRHAALVGQLAARRYIRPEGK